MVRSEQPPSVNTVLLPEHVGQLENIRRPPETRGDSWSDGSLQNSIADANPAPETLHRPVQYQSSSATTLVQKAINTLELLEKDYMDADAKRKQIREELGILEDYAWRIHEQKIKALGKDISSSLYETEGILKEMDDYFALTKRAKQVDDRVKTLTEEHNFARRECDGIIYKAKEWLYRYKHYTGVPEPRRSWGIPENLSGSDSLSLGKQATAERNAVVESTMMNIGAVVSAFGAGIAYTTLFSATRGRLDLISWSFTCFVLVTMFCAFRQIGALSGGTQFTRIQSMLYSSNFRRSWYAFVTALAIPMFAGFILLALSVALLDPTAPGPAPASKVAIAFAGYLLTGFLGLILLSNIVVRIYAYRQQDGQDSSESPQPSGDV